MLNKSKIVSGSLDKSIKLGALIRGKCLFTLTEHTSLFDNVVKQNNNEIATGTQSGFGIFLMNLY